MRPPGKPTRPNLQGPSSTQGPGEMRPTKNLRVYGLLATGLRVCFVCVRAQISTPGPTNVKKPDRHSLTQSILWGTQYLVLPFPPLHSRIRTNGHTQPNHPHHTSHRYLTPHASQLNIKISPLSSTDPSVSIKHADDDLLIRLLALSLRSAPNRTPDYRGSRVDLHRNLGLGARSQLSWFIVSFGNFVLLFCRSPARLVVLYNVQVQSVPGSSPRTLHARLPNRHPSICHFRPF